MQGDLFHDILGELKHSGLSKQQQNMIKLYDNLVKKKEALIYALDLCKNITERTMNNSDMLEQVWNMCENYQSSGMRKKSEYLITNACKICEIPEELYKKEKESGIGISNSLDHRIDEAISMYNKNKNLITGKEEFYGK